LESSPCSWFCRRDLVGINLDLFDVVAWDIRNFSVSVIARNKIVDVTVRITTVYGSPYEEKKDDFISELHELFLHWEGPAIIGGDFNLVRSHLDKSNGNIDHRWADKFNAWVDIWALVEIGLTGRAFTWANNQENLIMSRIDRIFCTTEFEERFPLAHARALPRVGSYHTPIVWDSGCDL
jgi:endonuclease/exonuclease/phosphatase (EEP) superfamily protein YafD